MKPPLPLVALLALATLPTPHALASRPYRGGAVATAHPEASRAALAMLDQGGNAVDAAVAAAFVLAVVGPYHSGLGGGGFLLAYTPKDRTTRVVDFREVAPAAAHESLFLKDGEVVPGLSTDGALSVAVPGAPRGYLEAQEKLGVLPRKKVLAPAIRLAKEGFRVTPKYQALASTRLSCLAKNAEARRLFLGTNADGLPEVPPLGSLIVQKDLANTLSMLAARGSGAFYEGRVAQALVDEVRAGGGILSLEDLKGFQVRWREPLAGSYRGHRLHTMPPPSAGGLLIVQVLGALEAEYPARPPPFRDVRALHFLTEATKRAFVDRAKFLGDPSFTRVPTDELSSPEHIAALARSIDRARATPSTQLLPGAAPAAVPDAGPKNTTHVSVLDRHGNAAALTTTINYSFGSCLVAKGTGVLLNDEMDDFAAKPMAPNTYGLVTGAANAIRPKKIPLSSMSPTLVFQKGAPERVMAVVGSPGGPTIPTTVVQTLLNLIDHGMDATRAVAAGRIHHQFQPDLLMVDAYGLEPETQKALEGLGHKVERATAWGDAELVVEDEDSHLRYSGSDPRNEGAALGQD